MSSFSKNELVQEALWRQCAASPSYFFKNFWHIQHPEYGAILFDLFEAQENALETFRNERMVITLKARQIGWTTLVSAYAYWLASFHPDRLIIFLSKGEREAKEILKKVVYGYKKLPEWMRSRVWRTNDNQTEFLFSNNSSIESLPSKSDPARGRSVYLVVVDEWAFLENPEDAWASIEPVADVGGRVIGLSTANGWGDFFHGTWVKARTGIGDFAPIFEPWDARDDRNDDWYAGKKANLPEWQLHQEYPRTEEEAFIQGGNPFFDVMLLAEIQPEEPEQGFLSVGDMIGFTPMANGALSVWERPSPEETYVVGADVAEGLEHGDYSSAHVIHWRTHKVVAHWHGHIPPHDFAEILNNLGRYYNNALVGCEANSMGLTTLRYLKDTHRYPNIFYARVEDERSKRVTNKIGWQTTKKTRPMMLAELDGEIRDSSLVLPCEKTIGELRTFIRDVNGKLHGSPYDDRVISLAIAVQMLRHAVQWNKARNREVEWTLDWWASKTKQEPQMAVMGAHNVR